MRVFREPEEGFWEGNAANFTIGAVAGLALGVLLSRSLPKSRSGESGLRERAGTAVRRLRPARLHRLAGEQEELDTLEDATLHGFLGDDVLRERAIDIGAISPGIIELSGTVTTEAEAQRAVALANGIQGVRTVVNRMEVKPEVLPALRPRIEFDESGSTFGHQESRVGGMGRRRQGVETDPDRPDDSQKRREEALAAADRQQWRDEGYTGETGLAGSRPEVQRADGSRFREDELDNQDPHGKRAEVTLDSQPQELNTGSRVGETPDPGIQREMRDAEVGFDESSPRDIGD
jgi:hypothetical protein